MASQHQHLSGPPGLADRSEFANTRDQAGADGNPDWSKPLQGNRCWPVTPDEPRFASGFALAAFVTPLPFLLRLPRRHSSMRANPRRFAASGVQNMVVRRMSRVITLAVLGAGAWFAVAPAGAQSPVVITGKSPGFDVIAMNEGGVAKAVRDLPELVRAVMARSQTPGVAVAVVQNGKTIYVGGFGVRRLGEAGAITPETVFQIASMSKPMSATIAAIAMSQGKASWSDPVRKHLPWFRLRDPWVSDHVTIGDFFSHRSGLPHAAGDNLEDLGFSRKEILSRLDQWPLDPFRASYNYANFGITAGAEAVAAAMGEEWENLAARLLFAPLGMNATSARHADYLARPNRASLHALVGGRFQPLYDRDPDAQSPAGGVSSNVRDVAEWMKLLLAGGTHDGKRLFGADRFMPALTAQARTQAPSSPDERNSFYGYGFNVGVHANGRTNFGHSGAFLLGAGTCFQILPSANLGVAVLTNGAPVGAAEAIVSQFMDIAQYGVSTRDWYAGYHQMMMPMFAPVGDLAGATPPASPTPAKPFAAYAGVYDNSYYGPVEITARDGGLHLQIGPKRKTAQLTHWSGDVFAMAPPSGENEPEGSRSSVRFDMQDGKAKGLVINYLDEAGLGRWVRQDKTP